MLFSELEVGQIIKGKVKSLQSFGVFVTLKNSDISGLCHISEVSPDYVKDLAKVYSIGDAVKAKILRLDQVLAETMLVSAETHAWYDLGTVAGTLLVFFFFFEKLTPVSGLVLRQKRRCRLG